MRATNATAPPATAAIGTPFVAMGTGVGVVVGVEEKVVEGVSELVCFGVFVSVSCSLTVYLLATWRTEKRLEFTRRRRSRRSSSRG